MSSDVECQDIAVLQDYIPFHVVLLLQVLASIISIILSCVMITKVQKLYFHINCKLLFNLLLLVNIVHSIFFGAIQSIHLVRFYTLPSCLVPVSGLFCFIFRYPASCCVAAFFYIQLCMIIERAVSIYYRENYEKFGKSLAIYMICSVVTLSLGVTYYTMRNHNMKSVNPYCTAITSETVMDLSYSLIFYFIVDIVVILLIFALYEYNRFAENRKSYVLGASYQITENYMIFRSLWPLFIYHFFFFAVFVLTNFDTQRFKNSMSLLAYRTLFGGLYTTPYYCATSPIILKLVIDRALSQRQRKSSKKLLQLQTNEKEQYFTQYDLLWNENKKIKSLPKKKLLYWL